MARRYADRKVMTLKEIARSERYSLPYVEKIFQKLRAAKIVTAHHGREGGYALVRDPGEITLKEIVEALEGSTFEVFCEPEERRNIVCTHLCLCGMKPVWKVTRSVLDRLYGAITLRMIATQETVTCDLAEAARAAA
jgi:Rrf2 family protein